MKRLLAIILLTLLLCACHKNDYGILDYQDKSIEAECIVNEKYKINIKKEKDLCTLKVIEPSEAQGISFEITENEAVAMSGDTKIQISKEHLKGVCALSSIFSQDEEFLTGASKNGGESVLTFETDNSVYVITLGENSMPKRVKINGYGFSYDVEICSIKLF